VFSLRSPPHWPFGLSILNLTQLCLVFQLTVAVPFTRLIQNNHTSLVAHLRPILLPKKAKVPIPPHLPPLFALKLAFPPAFWCSHSAINVYDTTVVGNSSSAADPIASNFYCSANPPFTKCTVRGDPHWSTLCSGVYTPYGPTADDPVDSIGGLPAWFVATIIVCGVIIFLAAVGCVVVLVLRKKHRQQAQRLADELDGNQAAWSAVDTEAGINSVVNDDDAQPIRGDDVDDLVGSAGSRAMSSGQGKSIMEDE